MCTQSYTGTRFEKAVFVLDINLDFLRLLSELPAIHPAQRPAGLSARSPLGAQRIIQFNYSRPAQREASLEAALVRILGCAWPHGRWYRRVDLYPCGCSRVRRGGKGGA